MRLLPRCHALKQYSPSFIVQKFDFRRIFDFLSTFWHVLSSIERIIIEFWLWKILACYWHNETCSNLTILKRSVKVNNVISHYIVKSFRLCILNSEIALKFCLELTRRHLIYGIMNRAVRLAVDLI